MKTGIAFFILVAVLLMIVEPQPVWAAGKKNGEPVKRLAALKSAGPASKASGTVEVFYQQGKALYQRLEVSAVGLTPNAAYELMVNGNSLDVQQSDGTGSVEFFFNTKGKIGSLDGAMPLPAGVASVLSIENVSIRDINKITVLAGSFSPSPDGGNKPLQQELGLCNNLTMEGGKTVTCKVPLVAPAGDAVTLSVKCDRGNFITVSGISLIIAPTQSDIGSTICTVTATDVFGLSAIITTFLVEVIPPDKPPTINPIPDQTV